MRTDAKIGFAIAGVLVAVVMVYFVVIPHRAHVAKNGTLPTEGNGTIKLVTPDINVPPAPNGNDSTPPAIAPKPAEPVTPAPTPAPVGPLVNNANGNLQPVLPDDVMPVPNLVTPTDKRKSAGTGTGSSAGFARVPTDLSTTHAKRNHSSVTPDDGDRATLATNRTYTVQAGQTLTSIASDVYGDPHAWKLIQRANPKLNPSRLRVGTKILIPDPAAVHPHPSVVVPASEVILADDSTDVSPLPGQTYRVQSGDSLYKIAKRFLGSGQRSDALFELNRDVIGANPAHLKLGMLLRLPSAAGTLSADASR